ERAAVPAQLSPEDPRHDGVAVGIVADGLIAAPGVEAGRERTAKALRAQNFCGCARVACIRTCGVCLAAAVFEGTRIERSSPAVLLGRPAVPARVHGDREPGAIDVGELTRRGMHLDLVVRGLAGAHAVWPRAAQALR